MVAFRRLLAGLAISAIVLGNQVAIAGASPAGGNGNAGPVPAAAVHKYSNCTKLNKVYPHGVGRKGAVDHVSGSTPRVRNFTVNTAVYKANTARDRDKDGIACEKR